MVPYLFILPFGLLFIAFFIAPILYGAYQSLFAEMRSGLLGTEGGLEFVGLANYGAALHNQAFVSSLGRVLLFGAVQVPLTIVMALVLALVLDTVSDRFGNLMRGAYFIPYGVPGVIASILWAFLYTPGLSPVLDTFELVGVDAEPLAKANVLWAIVNIVIWQMVGYNVLVITAQLKAIPGELIESATMDGAGPVGIALRIKLPLVGPAVTLTLLFAIIGTLQLFSEPMILQSATGNVTSTYTPNLSAYSEAFLFNDYHAAAAQAVILALLTFVLSAGLLRGLKGTR